MFQTDKSNQGYSQIYMEVAIHLTKQCNNNQVSVSLLVKLCGSGLTRAHSGKPAYKLKNHNHLQSLHHYDHFIPQILNRHYKCHYLITPHRNILHLLWYLHQYIYLCIYFCILCILVVNITSHIDYVQTRSCFLMHSFHRAINHIFYLLCTSGDIQYT